LGDVLLNSDRDLNDGPSLLERNEGWDLRSARILSG